MTKLTREDVEQIQGRLLEERKPWNDDEAALNMLCDSWLALEEKLEHMKRVRDYWRTLAIERRKKAEELERKVHSMQARFEEVVRSEEELDGDMPEVMFRACRENKDAMAEAMRVVVRQTKAGILTRLAQVPKA